MLKIMKKNLLKKRRLMEKPRRLGWILTIILVGMLIGTAIVPMTNAAKETKNIINMDENKLIEDDRDCTGNGYHVVELWNKTYGVGTGNSVDVTSDGGFVVTGSRDIGEHGGDDVCLLRTDSSGNILWEKNYGGSEYDVGRAVKQTADGGFIIAGETRSFSEHADLYLIRTDADGNVLWEKTDTLEDNWPDYWSYCGGEDVQVTDDGGFIVTGCATEDYYPEGSFSYLYLLRTDADGNVVWEKALMGEPFFDRTGESVKQTDDGGFIVAGYIWDYYGEPTVYLLKTDADGNILWEKTFGQGYGSSVQVTDDGGFIITGEKFEGMYLLCTDSDGNKIWSNRYGGTEYDAGFSVQQTSDGGYIVAGYTESYGAGAKDAYLVRTDADGNLLWDKAFGGINSDLGNSLQITDDGEFIVAGSTNYSYYGGSDYEIWLIKVRESKTIVVNWDGSGDYTTIQEGIDAAVDGDTVLVADGTYTGDGNRDIDFKGKAITVQSMNGPENCIVDCNGSEEDPHRGFYFHDNETSDSVLDGFTTRNGYVLDDGGGIWCEASPTIANCIIKDCSAETGGGVSCYRDYHYYENIITPTITNCAFASNKARRGGGIYSLFSDTIVTDCCIIGNIAGAAGGIYSDHSTSTITNCTIADNAAEDSFGGIWLHGSGFNGNQRIINCTITGNTADYDVGGIYCDGGSGAGGDFEIIRCAITDNSAERYGGMEFFECRESKVTNCIITDNAAEDIVGGIGVGSYPPWKEGYEANPGSIVQLTNCIIADNAAPSHGGIYCYWSSKLVINHCTIAGNTLNGIEFRDIEYGYEPIITNSILWFNEGEQITGSHHCTVTYSDVQGGYVGEGNIDVDPLFVTPDDGDYHLKSYSPCVNAGNPDFIPDEGETDIDGEPRVMDNRTDMGADESKYWPELIFTEAPNPAPYSDGALFGAPQNGYPGWVWFSIPLIPNGSAKPEDILGFDCSGKLFRWDPYGKYIQVYKPPFITWDLEVGRSYLLYLEEDVENPGYWGEDPSVTYFEMKLGGRGWAWIGMPGTELLGYDDGFMDKVYVQYPVGCELRSAWEDYNSPDPWINWAWTFYDTYKQAPKTFTPYAPFGNNVCYPWLGYRVWVNVGSAQTPEDPDQVVLYWT